MLVPKEFEAAEQRIKEIAKEKQLIAEEKQRIYMVLVQQIDDYINGIGPVPEELTKTVDTNPGKQPCSFFSKTSVCRFGIKCTRNHNRPSISNMILIPNFFTHIRLEQSAPTEYSSDLLLEYNDAELYNAFKEFFADTLPEFQKFGNVTQFRVCYNEEAHLRGNVYVEFDNDR